MNNIIQFISWCSFTRSSQSSRILWVMSAFYRKAYALSSRTFHWWVYLFPCTDGWVWQTQSTQSANSICISRSFVLQSFIKIIPIFKASPLASWFLFCGVVNNRRSAREGEMCGFASLSHKFPIWMLVYMGCEQTREYFGFLCACRGNFVIASVCLLKLLMPLEKKNTQTRFDNLLIRDWVHHTQRPGKYVA